MCGAGVQNVYKTENRCTEEDSIVSEMFRNTDVQNVRTDEKNPEIFGKRKCKKLFPGIFYKLGFRL